MLCEVKMPELLGKKRKEKQKAREVIMLECVYYAKLEKLPDDNISWESLENISFTKAVK